MIETVMPKWLILRNWKDSIQRQCYGSAVNGLGMTPQWRLWIGTKFLPVLPATPTQVGTCPDQLPLWRQEITVFPEMLPPLLQENCTVIPGALEDVFVMMLGGVDRWLHRAEEEECSKIWGVGTVWSTLTFTGWWVGVPMSLWVAGDNRVSSNWLVTILAFDYHNCSCGIPPICLVQVTQWAIMHRDVWTQWHICNTQRIHPH